MSDEPSMAEAYEELNELLEDITLEAKSKLNTFKTANGTTYRHLLRCETSTTAPVDDNTYCFLSNARFCFCEQSKTGNNYYLLTLYTNQSTGTNYVAKVTTNYGTHYASTNTVYPTDSYFTGTDSVYVKMVSGGTAIGNWACNFANPAALNSYNTESFPVFDTYEEALEYLTAPDGDFKVGVQDVPKVIDVYY